MKNTKCIQNPNTARIGLSWSRTVIFTMLKPVKVNPSFSSQEPGVRIGTGIESRPFSQNIIDFWHWIISVREIRTNPGLDLLTRLRNRLTLLQGWLKPCRFGKSQSMG